jgi:hypothetical protein
MKPMVQCTSKDLGSLAQQRVPPLLFCCWKSLHDHHKSPQTNVHMSAMGKGHLLSTRWRTTTLPPRYQKLPWWTPIRSADRKKMWPKLTPLDFYLWGLLKDVVYRRKPSTMEKLREEIETSCTSIPVETLATVARELVRRIQKWLQINGGHFENLFSSNWVPGISF